MSRGFYDRLLGLSRLENQALAALASVMRFFQRVGANLADMRAFGPQFLLRHHPRLTRATTAKVNVPSVGLIHLRAGESDVAGVRQVFQDGAYANADPRIFGHYEAIIAAGKVPVVVDAGANIGAASLWFLERFTQASIVAIEPEPGNLSVLRKNAKNRDRLLVMQAAVGSVPGHVALRYGDLGWATQTERSENGVPIVTMRQAFDSVPNGSPFIAKIDIEGFESDLFSKNLEWLDQVKVVYIEPHDWMLPGKGTSLSFQKAFGEREFELYLGKETITYIR
jgi:FkbM family methyltransferase